MKYTHQLLICLAGLCLLIAQPANAQDAPKEEGAKATEGKSYADLTKGMTKDEGLFTVHHKEGSYLFELPLSLMDKEVLVVTRVSGFVKGLNFGGAGVRTRPQQVVRWQRHDGHLLLRSVSYNAVADPNDPIHQSVVKNNFEPVIMRFAIKGYSADSTSCLIDPTALFTTDVEMIGALSPAQRKEFEIKSLEKGTSYIQHVKSYPINTEVRHVLTYTGGKLPDNRLTGTLSVEMNQSFILLPEIPAQPRMFDPRVGFFSVTQTDYSADEQRTATRTFITRWRLEPKDMAAWQRGELVEPIKPIVYYIDPATPLEWVPYIKKGVEDWQVAFEAIGFKNAILAKDAPSPEEDPEWSPEDARYSVIRYIATDIQNAVGPHVHDPRTGEILESDILWYHNVMTLVRNWYLVQTAAVNPDARGVNFRQEVMGELIRFVAAHEVGHTLGLPHNMGSSAAYAVDSLRSASFMATHGTAPSIMDYARFNYIAQPEDGITNFYPRIGEYDIWSIAYGYKPIPGYTDPKAEHAVLNEWIKEKTGQPLYRYGEQKFNPSDPTAQTEDLGDDPVEASLLGIKNLQRIVPELQNYAMRPGDDTEQLADMYAQIIAQFERYIRHVGTNVGGVYEVRKSAEESGNIFEPIAASRQRAAVAFLNEEVFATPEWLLHSPTLARIQDQGIYERLGKLQTTALARILEPERQTRLAEQSALLGKAAYTQQDLFAELYKGICREVIQKSTTAPLRRNMQRIYIDHLRMIAQSDNKAYTLTDARALAVHYLQTLQNDARSALKNKGLNTTDSVHLEDLANRCEVALEALETPSNGKSALENFRESADEDFCPFQH